MVADSPNFVATDPGYRAGGCPGGAAEIRTEMLPLLAQLTGLADRLEGVRTAGPRPEPVSVRALRAAALGCLDPKLDEPVARRSTLTLVIAGEWVQNLARLEAGLEDTVSAAVAASQIHWWR
jgi:hypothetical protein